MICESKSRKYIKIDFKDIRSVEEGLPLLKEYAISETGHVVCLNADVCLGPKLWLPVSVLLTILHFCIWCCHSTKALAGFGIFMQLLSGLERFLGGCVNVLQPIDPRRFINQVVKHCPGAHVSLGWKTIYLLGSYAPKHCEQMRKVCGMCDQEGFRAHIVLAMCARPALRSHPKDLIDSLESILRAHDAELLLWTGHGEPYLRPDEHEKLRLFSKEINNRGLRCSHDVR